MNGYRRWSIGLLLAAAAGGLLGCANEPTEPVLQLQTAQGLVRGAWADRAAQVRRFAGLRYAATPVGPLRFAAPAALSPWLDVADATSFGNACYQDFSSDDSIWRRGEFARSEDCLFLNLWTGARSAEERLPVMVWFHGGSHTGGFAHTKIFDGLAFAKQGVVLVTVNYRLGAFGFLAHPTFAQETAVAATGNYGLLDKLAALQWVQENIGAFGGDPNNVTIFGQSAGSMSVCALMASAASKGLFHKAIGQSAACINPTVDPQMDVTGRTQALKLTAHLGLTGRSKTVAAALRALPAAQLQSAAVASGWQDGSKITVDGRVLTEPPRRTFRAGRAQVVPLLLGSLANEGYELFPLEQTLTEQQLSQRLARQFGAQAAPLMALYAPELTQSAALAQREIFTDQFMAWGMRTWARYNYNAGAPTFLYFMQQPTPLFALYTPDDPLIKAAIDPRSAGAYHSGDLAYVFGNTQLVGAHWEPADHDLSAAMIRYWTNFARTGDPNGQDLPQWPAYDKNHATLILDDPIRAAAGVRTDKLDLFDQALQ